MKQESRIAFDIALGVIGFIFVALRLYVRYWIRRDLLKKAVYFINDVFVVVALGVSLSFAGRDAWLQQQEIRAIGTRSPADGIWFAVTSLKSAFYFYIAYAVGAWCLKASFLCNYFSAADGLEKPLHRSLVGTAVFTFATFCIVISCQLFMCLPIKRYWSLGPDNCLVTTHKDYAYVITILHLTSDTAIMMMGLLVVRVAIHSRGRREWIAICIIFTLGFITMISASIRFAVQLEMNKKMRNGTLLTSIEGDRVRDWVVLAAITELYIALVAASLPAFRIWVRKRDEARNIVALSRGFRSGLETKSSRTSKASRLETESTVQSSHIVRTIETIIELEEKTSRESERVLAPGVYGYDLEMQRKIQRTSVS